MNEFTRPPTPRPTTQAAEGLPRLKWTLAEFERLTELGVFTESDRIELIGGELVPMAAKGNRHEVVRDVLMDWIVQRLSADTKLSSEIGWRPNAETYLEPDIIIHKRGPIGVTVPPGQLLLLIEVARSSLAYDIGAKALVYAALGVREYWVVDAAKLSVRVHRDPAPDGYRSFRVADPDETLRPILMPELTVSLADLDLG